MMQMVQAMVGDAVPWSPRREPLGAPLLEPQWLIVREWAGATGKVREVMDLPAARALARFGVDPEHIWTPSETVMVGRGADRHKRLRLLLPGYLFALFDREPRWDVIRARSRHIRGVVSVGETPYVVPPRALSQMAQMPSRIRELRDAEFARLDALRPRAGDTARITKGPLAGYLVDIATIDRGLARFLTEQGVRGQARVETLEKVA